MSCDTWLNFQSISAEDIQWNRCLASNVEKARRLIFVERSCKYLDNDFDSHGELQNPHKRNKRQILKKLQQRN